VNAGSKIIGHLSLHVALLPLHSSLTSTPCSFTSSIRDVTSFPYSDDEDDDDDDDGEDDDEFSNSGKYL